MPVQIKVKTKKQFIAQWDTRKKLVDKSTQLRRLFKHTGLNDSFYAEKTGLSKHNFSNKLSGRLYQYFNEQQLASLWKQLALFKIAIASLIIDFEKKNDEEKNEAIRTFFYEWKINQTFVARKMKMPQSTFKNKIGGQSSSFKPTELIVLVHYLTSVAKEIMKKNE